MVLRGEDGAVDLPAAATGTIMTRAAVRRLWLAAAIALAAGSVLLWAWWFSAPQPFAAYQDVTSLGPGRMVMGRPYHFDMAVVHVGQAPIELVSVTPRFAAKSQRTVAWTISICEGGPEGSVGNYTGDLLPFCSNPRPASDGTFDRSRDRSTCVGRCDQMVMTMVPLRPGPVVIDGWDVVYRSGVRSGRQHIGDNVRLTAVP